MNKHTKGPWFYQEKSDVYTHIVRAESNPNGIICSCGQSSDGVDEANARLIAAAPELLTACKVSAACFRKLASIGILSSSRDVLLDNAKLIASAISKAESEV